ncbi:MAG: glycoside hydrolase family 172 protein, partial [Dehalococcoidia bacterium]
AYLWPGQLSRAASFEYPEARAGAGGMVAGGRKGAPSRRLAPGVRVTLADIEGPGRVGHLWLTVGRASRPGRFDRPALLRSQVLEVFYNGMAEPSISVPVGDFFGAVHGVPAPYASALTAVNEGRGFSSRIPLPFGRRLRIAYENGLDEAVILYYQVDVLLGPQPADRGFLHAVFQRENPTALGQDFCIVEGVTGPGRFLGWTGGVRVLDGARWWGEGEVKFYIDGESQPSICGTGTEDYLDSAWGLGTFMAPETGAPLVLSSMGPTNSLQHELVSFYRWHLSDPVVFAHGLRATVQQIGMAAFREAEAGEFTAFRERTQPAGHGWFDPPPPGIAGMGLYERADDWCGTAFVYLQQPQPMPRLDRTAALQDLPDLAGLHSVRRDGPPGA